jgi:fucose permease
MATAQTAANEARAPHGRFALVALAFLGFASLGLPDGALGVAWPRIRESFGLPLDALGALLVATVSGYAGASFCAGALLARISLGSLLALSCAATGATLLGYWAAPCWGTMIALGSVAGLGAGAIDAGINTFAATNFQPRTLHWLHAAYGLGTSAGPALMARSLLGTGGWRGGYLALGAIQLALALGFAATLRRWPPPQREPSRADGSARAATLRETLRQRAAQLSGAMFFLYLGVEATAGAWLYSLLEARGAAMAAGAACVSAYWGGLFAGRVAFGFAPNRWRADAVLSQAIAGCALAALGLAFDLGSSADVASAGLLGLAAAPIFPALIGATPQRVGAAHTANAVGAQIAAAALGQAGLPALVGILAARTTLEIVPAALAGFALGLFALNRRLMRNARAQREVAHSA